MYISVSVVSIFCPQQFLGSTNVDPVAAASAVFFELLENSVVAICISTNVDPLAATSAVLLNCS